MQEAATATSNNNDNNNTTTKLLRSGRKLKDVVRHYRQQQQQQQQGGDGNNLSSQQQKQQQVLKLSELFQNNQDGTDPWDVDPLEALENLPQTKKQVDKETGKDVYVISYTDKDFYDTPTPATNMTAAANGSSSSSSSSDSSSDSSSSDEEEEDGSLLYNEEGRPIRFEIGQNLRKRDMETGELLPGNPEEEFFVKDILDYTDPFPTTPLKLANRVLPLQETGDQVDDFVAAVYEHPTKYASISRINTTTPFRRPFLPTIHSHNNMVHYPPADFVIANDYKAYLYITNLPNTTNTNNNNSMDTADSDMSMEDALATNQVAEYVSNLLQVPITNVHTAHKHGAFVRFSTPQQAATTLQKTQTRRRQCHNPKHSNNNNNKNNDHPLLHIHTTTSNNNNNTAVAQIANVPSHLLSSDNSNDYLNQVFATFFPIDTDIAVSTTNTPPSTTEETDDSTSSSTTTTVGVEVHVSVSKEELDQVLKSMEFTNEWEQVRNYHSKASVFACHPKRVMAGYTGSDKSQMYYEKDTQLDIDYGLPSHVTAPTQRSVALLPDFYNSHAVVWHLQSLPFTTTKSQITQWLQPYCTQSRDTNGSIQMVMDADGHFQGSAYIGFDTLNDANTAIQSLTTTTTTTTSQNDDNEDTNSSVMTVHWGNTARQLEVVVLEDILEGGKWRKPTVGPRSERTADELWQALDEQHMVDQYLTEDDLEFLDSVQIDINVIKDAFMAARHGNVSYGMEDDGIVGERYSDDQSQGDGFREFCLLYMETLREVAATPEDPGLTYKSMFMPDETQDIDTIREDFEREQDRIQKLHKQHYPTK